MKEKTLIKSFTKSNNGQLQEVVPLYRSERGARLFGLTCWSLLKISKNQGKPLAELPRLTYGSEENEARLIQEAEGIGLRYEIFAFVGKVENLSTIGRGRYYLHFENLLYHQGVEGAHSSVLSHFRGVRGKNFVMIGRYGLQSFGVPQEVDMLADVRNDDGYVAVGPGDSVCIRVNPYRVGTRDGSYAAVRESILGGTAGYTIYFDEHDSITFLGDLMEN